MIKIVYAFPAYPMRAIYFANLILLHLNTLIIFGEAYRIWIFSLCSLLQYPAPNSLSSPNILLSTLFSNTFNLSQREVTMWGGGTWHYDEFHYLYCSPIAIRMIKSRRIRWAGYAACAGYL